ncbi:MAG TPA: hypothetical protein PKL31_17000 [Fulvivirga sp.]|nr:hypothetical protein [Fulvivirga sp.]
MRRISNNTWVGITIIAIGIMDITMYSSVDLDGIDSVDVIGVGLSVIGGFLLIWKYKLGWIFSTIYALKFELTSLYNLTTDYPLKFFIVTALMLFVIAYLNNVTTRFTMKINFQTQLITLGLGVLLALTNILI